MPEQIYVPLGAEQAKFFEEVVQPVWRNVVTVAGNDGPPYQWPTFLPLPTAGKAMIGSPRDMAFLIGVLGGLENLAMQAGMLIQQYNS